MQRWSGLGKAALVTLVLGLLLPAAGVGLALYLKPHVYTLGAGDMSPTYRPGQRITTFAVAPQDVRRGDAVVFSYATDSGDPNRTHFKRVIALGGDHVSQCGDQPVQLNGAPLDEPYLRGGTPNGFRCFDVTVPAGRMFVLGDHRANSVDSRQWDSVPLGTVSGRDSRGSAALVTVGALFLAGLPFLPVSLLLALLARRRRRTAPPAAPTGGYPAWVLDRTP